MPEQEIIEESDPTKLGQTLARRGPGSHARAIPRSIDPGAAAIGAGWRLRFGAQPGRPRVSATPFPCR